MPEVKQWVEKDEFIYFSKFDKKNWFNQFPLHEDDKQLVQTLTPRGTRMHTAMGYGHANGPHIGQNQSDKQAIESEVENKSKVIAWVDDDLMKHLRGSTRYDLIYCIRKYFLKCRKYDALLNPEKIFPFLTGLEFVGIQFQTYGQQLTESFKTNILQLKKPITVNDYQNFSGTTIFDAPFTPYYGIVMYWLHDLVKNLPTLKKAKAKKTKLIWNERAELAFDLIKKLLASTSIIYYVQKNGQILLRGDSCSVGMSSLMYQKQMDEFGDLVWRLCGVFSKQFPNHIINHHINIKEALAITW